MKNYVYISFPLFPCILLNNFLFKQKAFYFKKEITFSYLNRDIYKESNKENTNQMHTG